MHSEVEKSGSGQIAAPGVTGGQKVVSGSIKMTPLHHQSKALLNPTEFRNYLLVNATNATLL